MRCEPGSRHKTARGLGTSAPTIGGSKPPRRALRRRGDHASCHNRAGVRAAGQLHHHGGARLRLRLQRVRRRRRPAAAGERFRRPRFLRVLERRSDAELGRQFQSPGGAQLGQGNQHAMVQRRLQLQFQPRLGRDGADPHDQPHFDDRHRSVRRDSVLQLQGYRRHRDHGHVHRLLQGHVDRPHVRPQAADRHVHRPRTRPRHARSGRAAPT